MSKKPAKSRRKSLDPLGALNLIDQLQAGTVDIASLVQMELVPVARALAHMTGDKKCWIVGASVEQLKDYVRIMLPRI